MGLMTKEAFRTWLINLAFKHGYVRQYDHYYKKDRYCVDMNLVRACRDAAIARKMIKKGTHYDVAVVFGDGWRDWASMEFHRHLTFDYDGNVFGYGPFDEEIVAWAQRELWHEGWPTANTFHGFCDLNLRDLGE